MASNLRSNDSSLSLLDVSARLQRHESLLLGIHSMLATMWTYSSLQTPSFWAASGPCVPDHPDDKWRGMTCSTTTSKQRRLRAARTRQRLYQRVSSPDSPAQEDRAVALDDNEAYIHKSELPQLLQQTIESLRNKIEADVQGKIEEHVESIVAPLRQQRDELNAQLLSARVSLDAQIIRCDSLLADNAEKQEFIERLQDAVAMTSDADLSSIDGGAHCQYTFLSSADAVSLRLASRSHCSLFRHWIDVAAFGMDGVDINV